MQEQVQKRPILVTGSIRSGSTWTGKMLSLPFSVGYISEPFNPTLSYYGMKHNYFYPYVTEKNGDRYVPWVEDLLRHRVRKWLSRRLLDQLYRRIFQPRPLLKDPVAALASDWLARRFDMQVVVTFRHPAAVVRSCLRLGWVVAPSHWLNQRQLMEDWLAPYADQIRDPNLPLLDRQALNWLCVYTVLDGFIQRHPTWVVVRHEDLAREPLKQFRSLYQHLGIPFTPTEERQINQHTQADNPVAAPGNAATALKRDSRSLVGAWRGHFSDAELATIHRITAPVADRYYPDAW